MDYFYAQIEEKRHPEFENKLIVVCVFSGRTNDSGVVSSVNYKGRKLGIHAGMPIVLAKKLAPIDSVFLNVDKEHYELISQRIDDIVKTECEKKVRKSIDEWNIISNEPIEYAKRIKEKISNEFGLSCTIGIAPSILGAKMIASKNKPNGLVMLSETEEKTFIDNSDIEKIPGIGEKTAEELKKLKIEKVRDIKKIDVVTLIEKLGKSTGIWINEISNGRFDKELGEEKEQNEISSIGTLKIVTREKKLIIEKLIELRKDCLNWLIQNKRTFRTISLIFITKNLKIHTKSHTFKNSKNAYESTSKEEEELIDLFLKTNNQEIRRVGIKYGNLIDMKGQTTLF